MADRSRDLCSRGTLSIGIVNYSLRAVAQGQQLGPITDILDEDQQVDLDGTTQAINLGARIITSSTAAVSGVIVRLKLDGSIETSELITDSQGRATFTVPYGSRYTLEVRSNPSDNLLFPIERVSGLIRGSQVRVFEAVPPG